MAERVGFEPTGAYAPAVFKTAALNHSTISPNKSAIDFNKYIIFSAKCKSNC